MSRTVTALYDTRAEAEAARQRLASEVSLSDARILDQQSQGGDGASLDRLAMSSDDRHAFREGIKRGGFMLVAEVRGHEDPDTIVRVLEASSSIDLDERQAAWRRDGWSPIGADRPSGTAAGSGASGSGRTVSEQRVPLVEEQLVVGKREVERGGARVRSYVRDVPVHEQVTLRDEHVDIERRRVDKPLGQEELDRGDLLRDRNVEFRAVGEEPVVRKEAHLREEVVVRKTAEERPQQVHDTVARTEVDTGDGRGPSGNSGSGGGSTMSSPDVETPRSAALFGTPDMRSGTAPTATARDSGAVQIEAEAEPLLPEFEEVGTVSVGRQRSRPSRKLVIGSAVAGALVGGALPFMLGRKSRSTDVVVVEEERLAATGREETDWRREPAADTRSW